MTIQLLGLRVSRGLCALTIAAWMTTSACGDDDGSPMTDAGNDASLDASGSGGGGGSGGLDDGGNDDAQAGGGGTAGSAGSPVVCEDVDQDGHRAASCGGDDCDDNDSAVHPGATELCDNGVDDDCSYATSDHPDLDTDGYDCLADCNDNDRTINPARPEVCGNAIDDDCNGITLDLRDLDNDGFSCDVDCDDARASISPGADELCGTGVDEDCDTATTDVGDNDNDGLDCTYDCNDHDATLPNSDHYCGTSFNYFEGFEAGAGGWTVSGERPSWQHGMPQGDIIERAASGQFAWVTGIDSLGYNNQEASFLTSPRFDFSVLTSDPVLRFARIVYIGSSDGVWLEMSIDGGARWDRLPATMTDENLYADSDDLGFSDDPEPGWLTARTNLTGAAGEPDVRIRLVMFSDDGFAYEGFGFDDVRITDQVVDVALDAVVLPPPRCANRSAESVGVRITNHSSSTITGFDVAYSIDGATPVIETFSSSLIAGASAELTLGTPADLSAVGRHTVRAWVSLSNLPDEDRTNDAVETTTQTFAQAGAPDYAEDFEQDGGNWVGLGTRSSWARGTPVGDPIDGAGDGDYAWDTNPYGVHNPGEDSVLTSPCFDFSSLTEDPVIAFAHAYSLNEGEHTLEVAVGGGAFRKVGTSTSTGGVNWYNDTGLNVWNDRSGERGVWRVARHPLTNTASEQQVQVRFTMTASYGQYAGAAIDAVRIVRDLVDARVVSVAFPEIECQGRTSAVAMEIHNGGNHTLTNFEVSYQVDDLPPVVETVTASIPPGENDTYTFTNTLALTALGAHTITVRTLVTGQVDASQAVRVHNVYVRPTISGLNYSEDFESDDGDWVTLGEGSQWQHGRPQSSFADVITEAGSGENAWVTRLFGAYGPDWNGDLIPPCFDFSAYTSDPAIRFDHSFDSESADPMWLELSTDGLNWSRVMPSSVGSRWYNEDDNDDDNGTANMQWSGNEPEDQQWHSAYELLASTAGEATVQIRFRFQANGSNTRYEGHGIDTVSIENLVDAAVIAVAAPGIECDAQGSIVATIENRGTNTINQMNVRYRIDSGQEVSEQVSVTLLPGDTHIHTFSTAPTNVSAGYHAVTVTVNVTGDTRTSDNSLAIGASTTLNAQGYSFGFEPNDGGWSAGGMALWQWGQPSASVIHSANGGERAWVTNLGGEYPANALSTLTSPCFNFASVSVDPQVQLAHIFSTEQGYDGAWLEVSIDGGDTFTTVGAFGSGTNWYTSSSQWWSGSSGSAWRTARHRLSGVAGEALVRLRVVFESDSSVQEEGIGIDDFAIIP